MTNSEQFNNSLESKLLPAERSIREIQIEAMKRGLTDAKKKNLQEKKQSSSNIPKGRR